MKRPTRTPTEEAFWSRNSKPMSKRKLVQLAQLYEMDRRSITTLFNAYVDFDQREVEHPEGPGTAIQEAHAAWQAFRRNQCPAGERQRWRLSRIHRYVPSNSQLVRTSSRPQQSLPLSRLSWLRHTGCKQPCHPVSATDLIRQSTRATRVVPCCRKETSPQWTCF